MGSNASKKNKTNLTATTSSDTIEPYTNPPSPTASSTLTLDTRHADSITVAFQFWKNHVDSLQRSEQSQLAVLVYSHVFRNLPTARPLFLRLGIEEQSQIFLDMFGWLVRRVGTQRQQRDGLKERLKQLGQTHASLGVEVAYYKTFLEAMHLSLEERFPCAYTLRVKFSIEQVFLAVANVMTHQDLESSFQASRVDLLEHYLVSIDVCLRHPVGWKYLQKFMDEAFCAEIYMFIADYFKYQNAKNSPSHRDRIGAQILRNYVDFGSPREINLSYDHRVNVLEAISINGFETNTYDSSFKEMKKLIDENFWNDFRHTMCHLVNITIPELEHRIEEQRRFSVSSSRDHLRTDHQPPLMHSNSARTPSSSRRMVLSRSSSLNASLHLQ